MRVRTEPSPPAPLPGGEGSHAGECAPAHVGGRAEWTERAEAAHGEPVEPRAGQRRRAHERFSVPSFKRKLESRGGGQGAPCGCAMRVGCASNPHPRPLSQGERGAGQEGRPAHVGGPPTHVISHISSPRAPRARGGPAHDILAGGGRGGGAPRTWRAARSGRRGQSLLMVSLSNHPLPPLPPLPASPLPLGEGPGVGVAAVLERARSW